MDSSDPNEVTRVEAPTSDSGVETAEEVRPQGTRAPAREEPLAIGETFGRYVIVRKLGAGGMGMVYLAYDPQLDRGVALKVLRPGARNADRAQDRLLREAQTMARLSHPNVLPVYDVGTVGAHVYMTMEYVEGQSLRQWLDESPRPWAEVLEAFLGAGRGLAAAHEAGLVHRDFKPDNVMRGQRGRSRVMDFGLARAADDVPTEHERVSEISLDGSPSRSGSISSSSSGVGSLTRTGFVLGTPAYMAPEQHMGAAPDPAGDQFSFCVALYEGLYGARPFEGETPAEVCKAIMGRTLSATPAGVTVPGGLRRAVLRGLSPEPSERWPSMDELLGALTRFHRPRSRWRTGLAALGALGLVAGASPLWSSQGNPCAASDRALAEHWSDDHRQAVRDAFEQTGLSFAAESAEHAVAGIDAWGEAWTEGHRSACEATHVRREQSDVGLDLRMHCLQGRRGALGSLHQVLTTADRGTVEHAMALVERLPSPESCADLESLQAEVPPPDDPEARQRVEDLRAALTRIDALVIAARYAEARTSYDEAQGASKGLEYAPLQVEFGARQARLLQVEGDLEQAVKQLEQVLWQAETQGMDTLAVQVATDLVWLDGTDRTNHARGETWAALAQAKLDRLGEHPRMQAYLYRRRGDLADSAGRYDEAAEYYERALDLRRIHEPGSVAYAFALGDFGKTHYRAGRMAETIATFDQAREAMVEALGPTHPDVAKLMGNAATAHHRLGDYPRAQQLFEDSLHLLENAYGPDHLALTVALTNLGNVHYRQGHYDRAVEYGRRSIALKEAKLGPGHPKIGLNLNNVAMALSEQGHHEDALASFEKAEAALATLGPEHIALVEPRIGQGEELMHLDRHADAIEPLRSAYDLEKAHGHDPTRRALPAFLLARALWDGGGDRNEARTLATDGIAVLGETPEDAQNARLAQSLRTWLDEHPAP